MTLFSLPPLISTRPWGNVHGISRTRANPPLTHSLLVPARRNLTVTVPNPQPHPVSNINNHVKAV